MSAKDEVLLKLIEWPFGLLIGFSLFTLFFLVPSVMFHKDPVKYAKHYRVVNFFRGWAGWLSALLAIVSLGVGVRNDFRPFTDQYWNYAFFGLCCTAFVVATTVIFAMRCERHLFATRDLWRRRSRQ